MLVYLNHHNFFNASQQQKRLPAFKWVTYNYYGITRKIWKEFWSLAAINTPSQLGWVLRITHKLEIFLSLQITPSRRNMKQVEWLANAASHATILYNWFYNLQACSVYSGKGGSHTVKCLSPLKLLTVNNIVLIPVFLKAKCGLFILANEQIYN